MQRMKRTRLPSASDLDARGLVRIQVKDRQGNKRIKLVAPVDARELIYAESGTLDIDDDVRKVEDSKTALFGYLEQFGLDELRDLCKRFEISYVGKRPSDLRAMLVQAGITPDVLQNTPIMPTPGDSQ